MNSGVWEFPAADVETNSDVVGLDMDALAVNSGVSKSEDDAFAMNSAVSEKPR